MSNRFWDGVECPHEWCGGKLEAQDDMNVICLSCDGCWSDIAYPATHSTPKVRCLMDISGTIWDKRTEDGKRAFPRVPSPTYSTIGDP